MARISGEGHVTGRRHRQPDWLPATIALDWPNPHDKKHPIYLKITATHNDGTAKWRSLRLTQEETDTLLPTAFAAASESVRQQVLTNAFADMSDAELIKTLAELLAKRG